MKFGSFYGITVFNMLVFDVQPKFVKETLDSISYQKRLEIESDLIQEAYNLLTIDSFFNYTYDFDINRDKRKLNELNDSELKDVLASILCKGLNRDFNYFHYFGDSELLIKSIHEEFFDSDITVNRCSKDIKDMIKTRFLPIECDCATVCNEYGISRTLTTEYFYNNTTKIIDDDLKTVLLFIDSHKNILIDLIKELNEVEFGSAKTFFSENAIRNSVIEELSLVYKDTNKYNFKTTLDRVRSMIYNTTENKIDHSEDIKNICGSMSQDEIISKLGISDLENCIISLREMGLYGLNSHTHELYEKIKEFIPSSEGKKLEVSETLKSFVDSLIPIGGEI